MSPRDVDDGQTSNAKGRASPRLEPLVIRTAVAEREEHRANMIFASAPAISRKPGDATHRLVAYGSVRMLQVCAVDFTAYHLLGPLLRASRDAGWDVEFACADGPFARRLRDEGFRHRIVPMTRAASARRQLIATAALVSSLRERSTDLIHTHTPAGGIVGRAAALTWRGPVVHTFHGLPFQGSPHGMVERAFLMAERALSRRTSYFFSQAAGDLARAAALGIARAQDTLVIGNGVDTGRFRPDPVARTQTRAMLGIPEGAVVALTVARLVREKGLLELADAALTFSRDARVWFRLVGEALPSDRTSVAAELDAHPVVTALGERWRRLGHRNDVECLLQASDLFILPTYREGLPRSVVEAMACGVPVIATDIPACRELVRDGETGLLVRVRDARALAAAITALANDSAQRARMGVRARDVAIAEHDERLVLGRQLDVFQRLLAR